MKFIIFEGKWPLVSWNSSCFGSKRPLTEIDQLSTYHAWVFIKRTQFFFVKSTKIGNFLCMDLPRLRLLETPECKRVKTKTVKVENMESQHGILKGQSFETSVLVVTWDIEKLLTNYSYTIVEQTTIMMIRDRRIRWETLISTFFLHGGTTPWSTGGVGASTHFQPRPIPE